MPDDDAMMAWAAGLFEGEGSISTLQTRGRKRIYPALSLEMTCLDVVRRFHAVVGCGTLRERAPRKEGWKPSLRWQVNSAREVGNLLTLFLPFLGEKKASEAGRALDACAMIGPPMSDRTRCVHGHEYTPENTIYMVCAGYRQRRCRACKHGVASAAG